MDCRRSIQLEYFGERFTSEQCLQNKESACDNCSRVNQFKEVDVTDTAKLYIEAVNSHCTRSNFTVLQFVDLFKGASKKKIVDSGLNNTKFFGHLKHWNPNDIQRLFAKLIIENYLGEKIIFFRDIPQTYLKTGPKVAQLMAPGMKTKVMFAFTETVQTKPKKVEVSSADDADDVLTDKCYHDLIEVAKRIAEENSMTIGQVMNMNAIRDMSKLLPETEQEMLRIAYVTKANFDKYGQKFLEITVPYAAQRNFDKLDMDDEDDEADGGGPSRNNTNQDTTDWNAVARATSSGAQGIYKTKRKFSPQWSSNSAKRFKKTSTRATNKKSPAKKRTGASQAKRGRGSARPNLLPRPTPQF